MFDLEQEIRRWKRSISAQLPLHRDAVRELESHLRDAVDQRVGSGEPLPEAWQHATARMGAPAAIALEYQKLPIDSVWTWMPARIVLVLYVTLALLLIGLIGSRIAQGRDALLAIHVLSITLGYTAMLAIGLLATFSILMRAMRGWSADETAALRSTLSHGAIGGVVLTALGTILGGVWAKDHLGRFWGWDPKETAAALQLIGNLAIVLIVSRSRSDRAAMMLGLCASATTLICWFVPMLIQLQAAQGFRREVSNGVTMLGGLLTLHAVLTAVAIWIPGHPRPDEAVPVSKA